jgi:hypothetical protein
MAAGFALALWVDAGVGEPASALMGAPPSVLRDDAASEAAAGVEFFFFFGRAISARSAGTSSLVGIERAGARGGRGRGRVSALCGEARIYGV